MQKQVQRLTKGVHLEVGGGGVGSGQIQDCYSADSSLIPMWDQYFFGFIFRFNFSLSFILDHSFMSPLPCVW